MTHQQIWDAVLAEFELSVSRANFITWFHNTGISHFEKGNVIITVPTAFAKTWLEKKYHSQILHAIERISGLGVQKIYYKVEQTNPAARTAQPQAVAPVQASGATTPANTPAAQTPATVNPQQQQPVRSSSDPMPTVNEFGLNPRYVFETFIVGKTNELAHAAAQAVASRPGVAYNPLFIYGGVGLGKTHLLQAIGNELLRTQKIKNCIYVTCEKFTNDFLNSVRTGSAKEFKNRYRNVDLLMIDDVQFIAGKERTQEEFFHTFNELHQANKQIILSSDRPPKAISLEERLKSRFEWGMIVDVAPPDLETRIAILESKCNDRQYRLSKELLAIIATMVQNNIRELEGALNKIMAWHELKNITPTEDSVRSILSTVETTGTRQPKSPKAIVEIVAEFYGLPLNEILGSSREKRLAFPRQIIMYILREELKLSYPSIGEELGGRDHTTAMHAHNKISTEVKNNLQLKQEIEGIKARLTSEG